METETETVNLNFRYTQQEYVKGTRQFLLMSKTMGKLNLFLVPAFFVFAIFYFFFVGDFISYIFIALAFFATITEIMVYFYFPARSYKKAEKYHKDFQLGFSSESIVFKTSSIDSTLQWDVYKELWENREFYFIVQPSRLYTLIPKRVIAVEQKEILHKILSSALPCTKKVE
jgi:hypothetical protein